MEDFNDVAKARDSYKVFMDAMNAGREIMRRAGVPDPPPVPDFDMVFRRLNARARADLYAALPDTGTLKPADAIRLWQPLIKRAFGLAGG
jgi:hypothetical protein